MLKQNPAPALFTTIVRWVLLPLLLSSVLHAAESKEPTPVAFVDYKGEKLPVFNGIRPITSVPPTWPQGDHGSREPGHAVVAAVVDPTGKVIDTIVVESKPTAGFGAAAQKAVRKWRFPKILQNGQPVRCMINAILTFELEN